MFPDRRDVLVLAPLPVRAHTLLLAKVAAMVTALSLAVARAPCRGRPDLAACVQRGRRGAGDAGADDGSAGAAGRRGRSASGAGSGPGGRVRNGPLAPGAGGGVASACTSAVCGACSPTARRSRIRCSRSGRSPRRSPGRCSRTWLRQDRSDRRAGAELLPRSWASTGRAGRRSSCSISATHRSGLREHADRLSSGRSGQSVRRLRQGAALQPFFARVAWSERQTPRSSTATRLRPARACAGDACAASTTGRWCAR